MKNEAEFCTVIGHSLDWAHKISDSGFGLKPFDGFGILNGKPIYYEAKFSKKPESFNLQRIEDHQIANLIDIKNKCPDSDCFIILGIDYGRADKRVFLFRDLNDLNNRRNMRKNYLKKDLDKMPYYKIKKGVIDWSNLINPTLNTH